MPSTHSDRRRFLSTATRALAFAPLGVARLSALTATPEVRAASGASGSAFGPLRRIAAGELEVGYVEVGRSDAPSVILLHGWPYDIHSFAEVSRLLAARGYRVIVPYTRGFGTTRFRTDSAQRNAQQAALAVDVIELMNALRIEKAIIGGFDWGARTANIVAALWPERCKAIRDLQSSR